MREIFIKKDLPSLVKHAKRGMSKKKKCKRCSNEAELKCSTCGYFCKDDANFNQAYELYYCPECGDELQEL